MSYSVGHRCGSDPALLRLWCWPAAVAPIWPLGWELPYASGVALKRQKQTNKQTNKQKTLTPLLAICPVQDNKGNGLLWSPHQESGWWMLNLSLWLLDYPGRRGELLKSHTSSCILWAGPTTRSSHMAALDHTWARNFSFLRDRNERQVRYCKAALMSIGPATPDKSTDYPGVGNLLPPTITHFLFAHPWLTNNPSF